MLTEVAIAAPMLAPPIADTYPDLPDRKGYEYLEGTRVKVPMGAESNWSGFEVLCRVEAFIGLRAAGIVLPGGCALQIWPDRPRRYRKPDGSYFQRGRLPGDRAPRGMVRIRQTL